MPDPLAQTTTPPEQPTFTVEGNQRLYGLTVQATITGRLALDAAKQTVSRNALVLLRIPGGVDWNGETVHVVIGLAARGRGHIGLLSRLAGVLLDPARASALRDASNASDVYAALAA